MLALVWSSRAAAGPETERSEPSTDGGSLVVTSADACLTASSTVREIERFRPRRPEDVGLRIELRTEGDDLVAEIFRDGKVLGERPFPEAPTDCGERRRLVGIALAVALERLASEARTEAPPPEKGEAPASEAAMPPPPQAAPERRRASPRPARASSLEWTTDVHGEASAGVFPTPGFGAGVSVGPRSRLGSIELGVDWQRGLSYVLGPGEVDLALLSASARGCLVLAARRGLAFDACLAFRAGRWQAAGRGYERASVANEPWAGASAGLRASLALSSVVGLRVEVDAIVPVLRAPLAVRDGSDTLRADTSPVAGAVTFGPVLSF